MVQINKEAKRHKSKLGKSRATTKRRNLTRIKDEEEESSSSSMSMYNLDSDREYLDVPSHQYPTIVIHDSPLPMHMEEVHSSPIMEKFMSKRHSVIQEEDYPFSYNIEEMFGTFKFNICKKEVCWKINQKMNHNDGTMEEMLKDEVIFEKNDQDLVTVATTLETLTQSISHEITIMNEKLLET